MAEKENKAVQEKKEKATKSDKPSVFKRIGKWFMSLRSEAKKVSWASAASVRKNTIVVIICVIVVSAVLGILDLTLTKAIGGLSDLVRFF